MDKWAAFNDNDTYHQVALFYAGFMCDRCDEYFSGNPSGEEDNVSVPYSVIAEQAKSKGWLVEHKHGDYDYLDYLILCPNCRRQKDLSNQKTKTDSV
jgi:hypothetical protein